MYSGIKQKRRSTGGEICPRCLVHKLHAEKARNSLSRVADVYICNACGDEEAFMDAGIRSIAGQIERDAQTKAKTVKKALKPPKKQAK